jgi:hypothetical protein
MPPDGLDLDQAYQVAPVTEELADALVQMTADRDRLREERDLARSVAVGLEQQLAYVQDELASIDPEVSGLINALLERDIP